MDVSGRESCAFVPIEERVVLYDALEERCCFSNGILVVAGLRAEDSCLERTQISDAVSTSELVDYQGVNREDFDDSEVVPHLLGQLLV